MNRPWEDLYEITPTHIYNLYSKKGIFDRENMVKLMEPLFEFTNISINITLEEFYHLTGIDIHFFAIELNDLNIVDISHTTYPTLTVIEALCMTTCLPVVFEPFMVNDVYYVDAGLIVNYPLSYCLKYLESIKGGELTREDKLEILGLNINQENPEKKTTSEIIKQSNLIIYSLYMMKKLIKKKYDIKKPEDVPNTITYYTQESIFTSLLESLSSPEKRENYIQEGINYAIEFNLEHL